MQTPFSHCPNLDRVDKMQRAAKPLKNKKQPKKAVTKTQKCAIKTTKKSTHQITSPITTAMRHNANVTAAMVKKLRDATGAPMIECKKALNTIFDTPDFDTSNNEAVMKASSEWLRKRGAALANKNAGRSAKQGVVAMVMNEQRTKAALVELNCETDFVARNTTFVNFAARLAMSILDSDVKSSTQDVNFLGEHLQIAEYMDGPLAAGPSAMPSNPNALNNTASTELIDVITNCRENIKPRRAGIVTIPAGKKGFVAGYMHNEIPTPDESKAFFESINANGKVVKLGAHASIGSFLVDDGASAESITDAQDLGRKVMMQAVGATPQYLSRDNVPQEIIAKEKEIMLATTSLEGKPQDIVDKLLQGKLNKFFGAQCLLEQEYSLTNDSKPPTITALLSGHAAKPKALQVVKYLTGEILPGEEFKDEEQQQ